MEISLSHEQQEIWIAIGYYNKEKGFSYLQYSPSSIKISNDEIAKVSLEIFKRWTPGRVNTITSPFQINSEDYQCMMYQFQIRDSSCQDQRIINTGGKIDSAIILFIENKLETLCKYYRASKELISICSAFEAKYQDYEIRDIKTKNLQEIYLSIQNEMQKRQYSIVPSLKDMIELNEKQIMDQIDTIKTIIDNDFSIIIKSNSDFYIKKTIDVFFKGVDYFSKVEKKNNGIIFTVVNNVTNHQLTINISTDLKKIKADKAMLIFIDVDDKASKEQLLKNLGLSKRDFMSVYNYSLNGLTREQINDIAIQDYIKITANKKSYTIEYEVDSYNWLVELNKFVNKITNLFDKKTIKLFYEI